jgi:hypothetical protein
VPLSRRLGLAIPAALLSLAAVHTTPGGQPPTLPHLLGTAAAYVAAYEEKASFLLLEEYYVQWVQILGGQPSRDRRLRSELALVNTPDFGWIGFRDVFEVNGQRVGNRQERLQELFAAPLTEETLGRARALASESARFNLGSVMRTVNYPTMALAFLRDANQPRSAFARADATRVDDVPTWIVEFEETRRPTLIASQLDESGTSDLPASGRFWIEPDSGRVRRSQVTFVQLRSTGSITVEYGPWPGLDLLVPVSMRESFLVHGLHSTGDLRQPQVIRGEARYSNVRQFKGTARIKVGP